MALRDLKGLNVLVSGSTGLIGSRIVEKLQEHGCNVIPLTTSSKAGPISVRWEPETQPGFLSPFPIDESKIDVVIHLGGYPVQPVWSAQVKKRVRESRINGAKILLDWIAKLPPTTEHGTKRVFVCASGVGIYATKPSDYSGPAYTEEDADLSPEAANGFLHSVVRDAENMCKSVQDTVRVVHPRFGAVLSTKSGALKEMLLPFKLCFGGPIGSGKQMFPWVSLEDAAESVIFMVQNEKLEGAFNVVSPGAQETPQKRFAQALGKALHRPSFFPLPAFLVNLIFGKEPAEAILLGSMKVDPKALKQAGYVFCDENIEDFLVKAVAS